MKEVIHWACIGMAIIHGVVAVLFYKDREHSITRFQIWLAAALLTITP